MCAFALSGSRRAATDFGPSLSLLGVAEAVTTSFFAQGWGDLVAYVFLVITLIFFPTGLFGGGRDRV